MPTPIIVTMESRKESSGRQVISRERMPKVKVRLTERRDQREEAGDDGRQRDDEDDKGDGDADGLRPLDVGVLHLGQVVGGLRVARQVRLDRRRAHGLLDHVLKVRRQLGALPVGPVEAERGEGGASCPVEIWASAPGS